ncbi:MAG: hypothetical protein ACUVQ8_07500 [Nitrososphaeria archaeon]
MYGDEETGLPPTKLYTESYARKACGSALAVIDTVGRLLKEFEEESKKTQIP